MRSIRKFLSRYDLVGGSVMSFSLMGFMAYENREDPGILGAVGMIAVFFLIIFLCMFADERDARRHTSARRR